MQGSALQRLCSILGNSASKMTDGLASKVLFTTRSLSTAANLQTEQTESIAPLPDVKPDLVQQFLSVANMSPSEKLEHEKKQVIKQFQRHAADTASPEVTVAVWTHFIREQAKYFYLFPKDLVKLRHLELIIHKRRRLLQYLRRTNYSAYSAVINKLGLADVFADVKSADRYPAGKDHDDDSGAQDYILKRRFSFNREYRVKKTSQWKRLLPLLKFQDPKLPPPPARMIAGSVHRDTEK